MPLHGDFSLENIVASGDRVTILDFDVSGGAAGTWLHDVAYLFAALARHAAKPWVSRRELERVQRALLRGSIRGSPPSGRCFSSCCSCTPRAGSSTPRRGAETRSRRPGTCCSGVRTARGWGSEDGVAAPGRARACGPLVATRFLSAAVSTAIPLVLARALDLAAYGAYKQIFLVTQTLFLVLPFGMVQGLYYFVPRREARRPLYSGTLAFLGVASIVAVAGVLLGGRSRPGSSAIPSWRSCAGRLRYISWACCSRRRWRSRSRPRGASGWPRACTW